MELNEVMLALGCVQAMNPDVGGSSTANISGNIILNMNKQLYLHVGNGIVFHISLFYAGLMGFLKSETRKMMFNL